MEYIHSKKLELSIEFCRKHYDPYDSTNSFWACSLGNTIEECFSKIDKHIFGQIEKSEYDNYRIECSQVDEIEYICYNGKQFNAKGIKLYDISVEDTNKFLVEHCEYFHQKDKKEKKKKKDKQK